jgi:hypothetical protein
MYRTITLGRMNPHLSSTVSLLALYQDVGRLPMHPNSSARGQNRSPMANQRWNKLWRCFKPVAPSIESCDAAAISVAIFGWKLTAVVPKPHCPASLGLKEGYRPKGLSHSPSEAIELLCDENVQWNISPILLVSFQVVNGDLEPWEEGSVPNSVKIFRKYVLFDD